MALKIRCSAIGKIMTNPRSGGGLSETTKAYIQELFLEYEYGIRKEFWSRYTDKGISVEKDSIRLANEVLNWGLDEAYIEFGGQEYFKNEWIHGTTDVFTDWMLADVKSCWSGTTFPWFEDTLKSKDYYYQLQGYMWLTGHDKSDLAYCLVNTPEKMILDEIKREHWKQDSAWQGDENADIEAYVRSKHIFDHIPKENRVKNYVIEKDLKVIESIKERIELVREYYETLRKSEEIRNKIIAQ
jgi:hypothetical protein